MTNDMIVSLPTLLVNGQAAGGGLQKATVGALVVGQLPQRLRVRTIVSDWLTLQGCAKVNITFHLLLSAIPEGNKKYPSVVFCSIRCPVFFPHRLGCKIVL